MHCPVPLAQATDAVTNIYSWDPTARDVNGALIYNTYNQLGGWEDPMITGPMRYMKKHPVESAATYVDFTNQTYDKDTGRSYPSIHAVIIWHALVGFIWYSVWLAWPAFDENVHETKTNQKSIKRASIKRLHYTLRIFPPAIDIIPTCWL